MRKGKALKHDKKEMRNAEGGVRGCLLGICLTGITSSTVVGSGKTKTSCTLDIGLDFEASQRPRLIKRQ